MSKLHSGGKDIVSDNEERFNQLTAISNDWIWEMDDKGVFTYTNAGVTKILGYKPKEIIGKYYKKFIRTAKMVDEDGNCS